jgi:hypothetical protein
MRGLARLSRMFGLAVLAGCASAPPPPVLVAPAPPPPPTVRPRMAATAELGQIDDAATNKMFVTLRPALMQCYSSGRERLEFLQGDVKFYFRVRADGTTRWAFLEQSTLGDRYTEKCMLSVVLGARWPLPEDGEAEVHQGLGFDAPTGVRPPADWSAEHVMKAIDKASHGVAQCKQHASGSFSMTAYVHSQKGGIGKVLAAGAAAPTKEGDADIDCLVGVVEKMKVPSPGSYAAKVSFSL